MKKILTITAFLFISVFTFAQADYEIDVYNGQTIASCNGFFYDSGGPSSNYGVSEDLVITFNSTDIINTHIKVYFHEFDIDPSDTLYIYDGSDISAPLIGAYNNTNDLFLFPVEASINNPSGDLTFKFKSDAAATGTGWKGEISCIPLCQLVFADLDSINTFPIPNDSNYIDICLGDTIKFVGKGIYPQDTMVYDQDDATSTFLWDFGDGNTATGQTVYHLYTLVRGYDVGLTVTDSHGCVNTNYISIRVRISGNPIGVIHPLPNICTQTDSMIITVGYDPSSIITVVPINSNQGSSQGFDSTMFIPDGPYCSVLCYDTYVTFTAFAPGSTITSTDDILSICVDMEHSFVGDLDFTITCPNGQSVLLKEYIQSGGAYMGVPYGGDNHSTYDSSPYPCDPAYNTPGVGWNYCWSQIYPNIGTVNTHSSQMQLDSTNIGGNSGYYLPDQDFSQLIGCPLNGTWNIQICDNWASDNGYIFGWTLNLDPSLLPNTWSYEVPIDSIGWSGSFIGDQLDSSIVVWPDSSGIFTYTITIYDAFGCTYDTTLNITVGDNPIVDIGNDTSICLGSTITLDAGNPGLIYLWSPTTGLSDPNIANPTASPIITTTYVVTVSDIYGCTGTDDITISMSPSPPYTYVTDSVSCNGGSDGSIIITPSGGNLPYSYAWNPSVSTSGTANNLPIGTYTITVSDANGCSGSISINVSQPTQLNIAVTNVDSVQCFGESGGSISVNASGGIPGYTYLWNTVPPQTSSTASGIPAGVWTVTVTDANGCIDTYSTTVYQPSQLNASVTDFDSLQCWGQTSGSITIAVNGGTPGYTYLWDTSPQQTTEIATNLPSGTYTITITDHNGCTNTQSAFIYQPSELSLFVTPYDEQCENTCDGQVTTAVGGGVGPYVYAWSNSETSETITGLCPGSYAITVTDANGCFDIDNATVGTVTFINAEFTAYPPSGFIPLNVDFNFTGYGADDYYWDFGDGTISNSQDTVHTYTEDGTYTVVLIINSGAPNFCPDTFVITIIVEIPSSLVVPNVFTPNNDGFNDEFFVQQQSIETFDCVIFNRWGSKIFEWTDATQGWDGKTDGGSLASEGVYFYILTAKGIDDVEYNMQGTVTLIR